MFGGILELSYFQSLFLYWGPSFCSALLFFLLFWVLKIEFCSFRCEPGHVNFLRLTIHSQLCGGAQFGSYSGTNISLKNRACLDFNTTSAPLQSDMVIIWPCYHSNIPRVVPPQSQRNQRASRLPFSPDPSASLASEGPTLDKSRSPGHRRRLSQRRLRASPLWIRHQREQKQPFTHKAQGNKKNDKGKNTQKKQFKGKKQTLKNEEKPPKGKKNEKNTSKKWGENDLT